jgi:hypothetical protein
MHEASNQLSISMKITLIPVKQLDEVAEKSPQQQL